MWPELGQGGQTGFPACAGDEQPNRNEVSSAFLSVF